MLSNHYLLLAAIATFCDIAFTTTTTACDFQCLGEDYCIPNDWVCDREYDCENGADEVDCKEVCEGREELWCAEEDKCIPNDWVCDGENDCENGIDESDHQDCKPVCDKREELWCAEDDYCVRNDWLCDGENDCGKNGIDEGDCKPVCEKRGEFWCSGTVIPSFDDRDVCLPNNTDGTSPICDGIVQCADGSDESVDLCKQLCDTKKGFWCPTDEECISRDYVCDGVWACYTGEDEDNCQQSCIDDGGLWCEYNHEVYRGNMVCVKSNQICDDWQDCYDQSDEPDSCVYTKRYYNYKWWM